MSQITVFGLRRELTSFLEAHLGAEATPTVRGLLATEWGWSLTDMALRQQDAVPQAEADRLRHMAARLAAREPLQYVCGRCDFCGLTLSVGPGVLIPRPETEQLVELARQWARGRSGLRVMDIGTGSGCIAIALSRGLDGAEVSAIDCSAEAVERARANARGTGVKVWRQDILTADPESLGTYDIVVSNPPYVRQSERAAMEANVLEHEPESALFVPDDDPLIFYRHITRLCAGGLLAAGGGVFFEINEALGRETLEMMTAAGLRDAGLRQDYLGKDRFAFGFV